MSKKRSGPNLSYLMRAYLGELGEEFSEDAFDGFLYHLTQAGYKASDWSEYEWASALIDAGEDDTESFLCTVASWTAGEG